MSDTQVDSSPALLLTQVGPCPLGLCVLIHKWNRLSGQPGPGVCGHLPGDSECEDFTAYLCNQGAGGK
jgi:hypothetical protein